MLSLEEYFPALAELTHENGLQVCECDRVMIGSTFASFGRRGDSLLVSRAADQETALRWLTTELLPHLTDHERTSLVEEHLSAEFQELATAVSQEPTDALRIARLLGEQSLNNACMQLAPWAVGLAAEQRAEQLLTMFGPSTLKQLKNYLPGGLGVPSQWVGGTRTLEFVQRLGFDESYAGRRKAERPDLERVLGPTVTGELHKFQREIADRVIDILAEHGRGIVDLPTGAGKTRIAIESILDHADSSGSLGTVLWIAEREELCEQAVVQWMQLWRTRGLADRELSVVRFWGSRRTSVANDHQDAVVVATRQQLLSRLESGELTWLEGAGLVVIDEAHHSTSSSYLQIIKWREVNDQPFAVLGLSATPFRADVKRSDHLARLFDRSLVTGQAMGKSWKKRIKWLQENSYLSHVDWEDLDRGLIEPTDDEVALLIDQPNLTVGLDRLNKRLGEDEERNRVILASIKDMGPDWPVIVFAGSVEHAKRLAIMLNEEGISARPVWGELDLWARRQAIQEFSDGRIQVLTNYNVLSEGFDAPKTRAVVIARLVLSNGLFIQMLGRGMRGPNNGGTENCLLVTTGERLSERFDPSGNLDIERHEYLWSNH